MNDEYWTKNVQKIARVRNFFAVEQLFCETCTGGYILENIRKMLKIGSMSSMKKKLLTALFSNSFLFHFLSRVAFWIAYCFNVEVNGNSLQKIRELNKIGTKFSKNEFYCRFGVFEVLWAQFKQELLFKPSETTTGFPAVSLFSV